MKTPKDWIRFETVSGRAMLALESIFGIRCDRGEHYILDTNGAYHHVTNETAEEVVELVAKYRESR